MIPNDLAAGIGLLYFWWFRCRAVGSVSRLCHGKTALVQERFRLIAST